MREMANKVPAVTLAFWIIKTLATTLGETGGDALSMQLGLGYLASTAIFAGFLAMSLAAQIAVTRFYPALYWLVIVATATVGTTTSDYLDRTVGLGYTVSSATLLAAVLLSLAVWRLVTGSISVSTINTRRQEFFYWLTIIISNTLGTALGDWLADTQGVGFAAGASIFAGGLLLVAALYFWTGLPRTILFWAAFVLTRPFGATFGDVLTKPVEAGGFDLSRIMASLFLAGLMVLVIVVSGKRAEKSPAPAA